MPIYKFLYINVYIYINIQKDEVPDEVQIEEEGAAADVAMGEDTFPEIALIEARAQCAVQLEEATRAIADQVLDVVPLPAAQDFQPSNLPPSNEEPSNVPDDHQLDEIEAEYPESSMTACGILSSAQWGWEADAWRRQDEDSCLLRAQSLVKQVKAFIQKVRIVEGYLSRAQCSAGSQLEPGSHNDVEHRLSLIHI